jgi:hypothetical protein
MKTFQKWVEDFDQQPSQAPPLGEKGGPDDHPAQSIDRNEISEDSLTQIIRIAYKKHRHQTEKFIQRLADVDPEIKSAMSGNKVQDRGMDHIDPNKDEVMPPEADGAPALDSDQGSN